MSRSLRELIVNILADENLPPVEPSLREIPFEGQLGLALSNVFRIAREAKPDLDKKELKAYVDELAGLIGRKLEATGEFERVEVVKGYVNCFLRPDDYARRLLERITAGGTDWAKGEVLGRKVMVEYSQPNTHKAFHIGHVRNVVTGAALVRCFRYAGRDTVAANYYGDIGSHVFKALWYLEKVEKGHSAAPEGMSERGLWLGDIYTKADSLLTESEQLKDEVWDIAGRWYASDRGLVELWEETRKWSLDDFHRIYGELGAMFDVEFYESQVEREGLRIVGELEKRGIVAESGGAKIVEIDRQLHERFGEPLEDKYRVLVLVRADGASLYGAKDLALAKRKFDDYDIDESIYVVGVEQKFYFQQLFQILRLMGFPQWERCFHLAYELVMLPGGKISSRKGQVVLYDDVMSELKERAFNVVQEKNPALDEKTKREVSEMVAKGALIYGMLRVDTNKKINFDFDEVLDFDGRSAPYIQYACARANSIFRKAVSEGIEIPDGVRDGDFFGELKPIEIDLVGLIGRFPAVVQKVVDDKKPIHLASYAYDLAVAFSDFYHQCPVLAAEPAVRRSRMLLVRAVRSTLEAALGLMGISAPDVM